jgi:hypothetical protein
MRIRWRGDHAASHPELGELRPGELASGEVSPERAAELAADPSGWFELVPDAEEG